MPVSCITRAHELRIDDHVDLHRELHRGHGMVSIEGATNSDDEF